MLERTNKKIEMPRWSFAPAPRFPQPPTRALAVPTTSLVNIRLVQYWHMTNVLPASPIHIRRKRSPFDVCTNPVQAVGIAAKQRTHEKRILAPNTSHMGPMIKRMRIVPPTPAIEELQMSCVLRSRSFAISGRSGEMANQMKKATKNDHHEQWKALM